MESTFSSNKSNASTSSYDEDDVMELSDFEYSTSNENRYFTTLHWDGTNPEPTGILPTFFAQMPIQEQFQQLELLITYNDNCTSTVNMGDFTNINTPFLTAIPGVNRKLKVLHTFRNANAYEFLKNSKIQSSILTLTGDLIPSIQIPSSTTTRSSRDSPDSSARRISILQQTPRSNRQ